MSWVMLRGLARTIAIRLFGIALFTAVAGLALTWLLDVAISEPEGTETAAIAPRAGDRGGLPELLAGQSARSPKRWSEETARLVRELPGVVRIQVWDPQGNVVWGGPGGPGGQGSAG